jgi:hypothetical protein
MISGTTTSLRPIGIGRFISAAFLSVWLVGWIVGEVFAIGMLASIASSLTGVFSERLPAWSADMVASGGIAFALLFLLFWLTFWTIGGIVAITHVARSLVGEDVIGLTESGFEIVRRAGPFARRFAFDRTSIRRLRLRSHDKAVVVDTPKGPRVITTFGMPSDRDALVEWLTTHLGLPPADPASAAPPATWDVQVEEDVIRLRKIRPGGRLTRAVIAWGLTAAIAYTWYASVDSDHSVGSIPALMLTVLLVIGAGIVTWGRREWIVRSGELTFRRSVAMWTAERTFRSARLEVIHETDSDNDSHYKVIVVDDAGRKTVHSQVHDSGEVVDLAQWLAQRTGFPLTSAERLLTVTLPRF